MDKAPRKSSDGDKGKSREERLKAALKANIARRKEQARRRGPGEKAEPEAKAPDDNE